MDVLNKLLCHICKRFTYKIYKEGFKEGFNFKSNFIIEKSTNSRKNVKKLH